MQTQILIFDGFEELDVFGVFEPLRMAGIDVKLASVHKQDHVKGFYGTKLIPDLVADALQAPDLLIVPGGGWIARSEHGAWTEAAKGTILEYLKQVDKTNCIISSVCAGAMLLAKAGLLKNRTATTNLALFDELRDENVNVINTRVVDDGKYITAGGITSSLDLGIYLIQKFRGIEKGIEVSSRLEFEPRGSVWRPPD